MAEWHVSGSESDPDGGKEIAIDFGGLEIPPSKVLELFHSLERRKALDLDCLSDVRRKERRKKKKHKRSSLKGMKSVDDVSETTASEIRSTTSTTECRDVRRPNLARFDFFHEDSTETAATRLVRPRRRPPPDQRKEKKLASLDRIVADVKRHKQKEMEEHKPLVVEKTSPDEHPAAMNHIDGVVTLVTDDGSGERSDSPMEVDRPQDSRLPRFSFDEDSDLASPTSDNDMKFSLLSQINRVEKLLDSEGLT